MALKQIAQTVDSVMDPADPKLDDELVAHIMAMLAVARDYVRPLPELVQSPAGTVAEDLRQIVEALRLAKLEPPEGP